MSAAPIAWFVLALAAGGVVTVFFGRTGQGRRPARNELVVIGFLLSVTWWLTAASLDYLQAARFAGTSLLGFAAGNAVGFLFTSYEDELASVGKVRDWLLGGIVALTFSDAVKGFSHVRALLTLLAGVGNDIGQHAAMLVSFGGLGFYVMFVHRELTLNPLLQARRNDRKRLEEEGRKIAPVLALADAAREEVDPSVGHTALKPEDSRSIAQFIAVAQEARAEGQTLDPSTEWKLAKAYFLREQYEKAIPLLEKAIAQPEHTVDAGLRLAQAYGEMGDQKKAVDTLEALTRKGPTRPVVLKLLGYYLLWIDERLDEAIQYTTDYLNARPNDSGALFNLACAYAQKFAKADSEEAKALALRYLRLAIEQDPPWKLRAASLANADGDFAALKEDPSFQELLKA